MTDRPAAGDAGGRPPELRLRRRFFSVPTLIAYVVAIGVLALTLSRVFDIDWSETWDLVRSTDPLMYVFALLVYYLSFWFRGARWVLLAKSAELDAEPGVRLPSPHMAAVMILMGWFANSVAFMRLGDAYRALAFARESGAGFAATLGTVFGERAQDMAVVLALLLLAAGIIATTGRYDVSGWVVLAAILLVAAILALLITMRIFGLRVARRLPARLQSAYAGFQSGALAGFRPRNLPLQLLLGAIAWMLESLRLYLVARGIGLDIDMSAAMFVALSGAMLSTIPTPGGLGFVESGLTGVLLLLGLSDNDALALILVDRSITWISIIVIGGAVFFAWQVVKSGRQLPEGAPGAAPGVGSANADP